MGKWEFVIVRKVKKHNNIKHYHLSWRSIYQKFREVDLLDKKKTVTALKPGEDRAILLGLGMILSSVMLYFVLGITILRSYADRYSPDIGIAFFFFFTPYKVGLVNWYFCQNFFFSFIRCACGDQVPSQPENSLKLAPKLSLFHITRSHKYFSASPP